LPYLDTSPVRVKRAGSETDLAPIAFEEEIKQNKVVKKTALDKELRFAEKAN
jgi:hypothetical protein